MPREDPDWKFVKWLEGKKLEAVEERVEEVLGGVGTEKHDKDDNKQDNKEENRDRKYEQPFEDGEHGRGTRGDLEDLRRSLERDPGGD